MSTPIASTSNTGTATDSSGFSTTFKSAQSNLPGQHRSRPSGRPTVGLTEPRRSTLEQQQRFDIPLDLTHAITPEPGFDTYGVQSDVYKGTLDKQQDVTLKRITSTGSVAPMAGKNFNHEIAVWHQFQHQNVLQLLGIFTSNGVARSVSPWMDNGNALDFLKKDRNANRQQILSDAAKGLSYIHSQKVVHADVRSANIMVDSYGIAYVSSFGLARALDELSDQSYDRNFYDLCKPQWVAREIIEQDNPLPSLKSDVWSFGMFCLEVVTGQPPYPGWHLGKVMAHISQGGTPNRPQTCEAPRWDDLWSLMKDCWYPIPVKRPNMQEVVSRLDRVEVMDAGYVASVGTAASIFTQGAWALPLSDRRSRPSPPSLSITPSLASKSSSAPEQSLKTPVTSHSAQSSTWSDMNPNDPSTLVGTAEGLLSVVWQAGVRTIRDTFLACHGEFMSGAQLCKSIEKQYEASSDKPFQQLYELEVLDDWLQNYFIERNDLVLLDRIQSFLNNIVTSTSSGPHQASVHAFASKVINRLDAKFHPKIQDEPHLQPQVKEHPTVQALAAALTELEVRYHKQVLAGDCVNYLLYKTLGYSLWDDNMYQAAVVINEQITLWAKISILEALSWQDCCEYIRFFSNTAVFCSTNLKNVSSMLAIVEALKSTELTDLIASHPDSKVKKSALVEVQRMAQKAYQAPFDTHRAYLPRLSMPLLCPELPQPILTHSQMPISSDGNYFDIISFKSCAAFASEAHKFLEHKPAADIQAVDPGVRKYLDVALKGVTKDRADRAFQHNIESILADQKKARAMKRVGGTGLGLLRGRK